MSVTVMSQNMMCWGTEGESTYEMRRPLIKKALREHGADIIGAQEVHPVWKEILSQDIAEYGCIFKYRSETSTEAVPIYWRRDRLTLIDSGWFWLSETPDTESKGWDAKCFRITTWGRFEEIATGKQFVFVNTHLDHAGETARIKGIELICDYIKNNIDSNIPYVLTGDFNTLPDSGTIEIANRLMTDARACAKVTTDKKTYYGFGKKEPSIIDYIYLSKGLECERFDTVIERDDRTMMQSDHCGLIATINL